MLRLAHAPPLMITLIPISLSVFHSHVLSCALVHTVQISCWDTRGCSAWYDNDNDDNSLEGPTESFAPLVRGGVYLHLDSLIFALIFTPQIPHYAFYKWSHPPRSDSCKHRPHFVVLVWAEAVLLGMYSYTVFKSFQILKVWECLNTWMKSEQWFSSVNPETNFLQQNQPCFFINIVFFLFPVCEVSLGYVKGT